MINKHVNAKIASRGGFHIDHLCAMWVGWKCPELLSKYSSKRTYKKYFCPLA